MARGASDLKIGNICLPAQISTTSTTIAFVVTVSCREVKGGKEDEREGGMEEREKANGRQKTLQLSRSKGICHFPVHLVI